MSSFLMNQDPNNPNNKPGVGQPPVQVTGGGSPLLGAAPAAQKQQGSGNFTNLQRLLGANQGAGAQMATKIGSGITQQGQGLAGQQDQVKSDVGSQITAAKTDQSAATGIKAAVDQAKGGNVNQLNTYFQPAANTDAGNTVQPITPPTTITGPNGSDVTGNPALASAISKGPLGVPTNLRTGLLQDLVSGTNTLDTTGQALTSGLTQTGTALQNLQSGVSALGTSSGRAGLLQNLSRRPGYNPGMSALNQTILQTGGGDTLANVQNQGLGALQQGLQNQKGLEGLSSDISGLKTGYADISKDLKSRLSGAVTGLSDIKAQQAKDANAAENAKFSSIADNARNGNLTNDQLQSLGLGDLGFTYGKKADINSAIAGGISPGTYSGMVNASDLVNSGEAQAFKGMRGLLGDTSTDYTTAADPNAVANKEKAMLQPLQKNVQRMADEGKDGLTKALSGLTDIGWNQNKDWNSALSGAQNLPGYGGHANVVESTHPNALGSLQQARGEVNTLRQQLTPDAIAKNPNLVNDYITKLTNLRNNIQQAYVSSGDQSSGTNAENAQMFNGLGAQIANAQRIANDYTQNQTLYNPKMRMGK